MDSTDRNGRSGCGWRRPGRIVESPGRGASTALVAVLLGVLLWMGQAPVARAESGSASEVNAESVYALLDLIDTIAESNPGYEDTLAVLATVGESARRKRLIRLAERNASNPSIKEKIDAFLSTETRQIYFRRFRNVTPDHFRRVFESLPYEAIPAPGSIASPYMELFDNRNEVRTFLDHFVEGADLERCRDIAAMWLPVADYEVPDVALVYDNNAGSYTAEGRAFYNLCSPEGAAALESEDASAVMAHELHHVLAERYFRFSRRQHEGWENERLDMVVLTMVSEGTAIHCNPPDGFKKALWEDRETIRALLSELSHVVLSMENGELTESEFRKWYSSTFDEIPRMLLDAYVRGRFGDAEADAVIQSHLSERPDLVHTLGWWMVSRISSEGQDPDEVRTLVQRPYELFERYNEVMPDEDLRVDTRTANRVHGGD